MSTRRLALSILATLLCLSAVRAYTLHLRPTAAESQDFYTEFYTRFSEQQSGAPVDRGGDVTTSQSCVNVTSVPATLRSAAGAHPESGLAQHYTKYTHAYGIPVMGSSLVPDAALSRACYVLRFLLADRLDLRRAYYRSQGRVVVLPRGEALPGGVPEYAALPAGVPWPPLGVVRSLGAVPRVPVTSGGEENVLCEGGGEEDDMLLKSLAIGILNIAVGRVDAELRRDVVAAYRHALASDRWTNTNAARGPESYFGEGAQSFYNVNAYASPANGHHNEVSDRVKLATYDPTLFALVRRVFPCANTYLKRCHSRGNEARVTIPMNCPPVLG